MNQAAHEVTHDAAFACHPVLPIDERLAASQFCLAKCPTSGCAGVCNQLAEYVNHTHKCPAGHTWR